MAEIGSEAILDSLPDGVYITDTNRRILFWNHEAERMTGWRRSEVVGRRCHDNVLCHIDKDGHLLCGYEHCPLHRAMVTGTSSDLPHLIFAKCRDGERIPVEVTVAPLRNPDGEVIGGIEVFRDLSPAFQDLNRARLIQQETMALVLPEDARVRISVTYTPHDQVGGDFYRAERLPDGRYALLVADVIGHGLPAALHTMQLRTLWDEGRERLGDPRAFLEWLNQRLAPLADADSGYVATGIHAVYDPTTGGYEVGCAGHPPPLVIRKQGGMEAIRATGPGLGLIDEPKFSTDPGALEPGDHLVFFTDGAHEVMNYQGEELGEAALKRLIREALLSGVPDPLGKVEEAILRFSNEVSLPDDLTLIDLARTG